MEGKKTGLFRTSKKDSKYFNDKNLFIELESCPLEGKNCIEHRAFINRNMRVSLSHLLNKEYTQSIEELKTAYYKTAELNQATCIQCAELFRSTIMRSMEHIQEDLHKMSTGLFKVKRFNPSLEQVNNILKEFKKES
jgi:hypothetical protein